MIDTEKSESSGSLEMHRRCPKCRRMGAYYLGSTVQHGNPYACTSDTEVDHHYRCANERCGHTFDVYS